VLGWGSTFGAIKTAVAKLSGGRVIRSLMHIYGICGHSQKPGDILKNFETVIIPEINNGQLIKIIRDVYFVNAIGYNKIMGIPITKTELVEEVKKYL
jgi:2-oxoglutarate ferredoxin oxidoreductase subunit alpha